VFWCACVCARAQCVSTREGGWGGTVPNRSRSGGEVRKDKELGRHGSLRLGSMILTSPLDCPRALERQAIVHRAERARGRAQATCAAGGAGGSGLRWVPCTMAEKRPANFSSLPTNLPMPPLVSRQLPTPTPRQSRRPRYPSRLCATSAPRALASSTSSMRMRHACAQAQEASMCYQS
jgi:hypothetical protein